MVKNDAIKWQPALNGAESLIGDGVELTDEQKVDQFFVEYQRQIDPIRRYEKYFKKSGTNIGNVFRQVKRLYLENVVQGTMDEARYVKVLDNIFTKGMIVSRASVGQFSTNKKNVKNNRRTRW